MQKKKTKLLIVLFAGLFVAGISFCAAQAQKPDTAKGKSIQAQAAKKDKANKPVTDDNELDDELTANETDLADQTKPENKGQINAASHRSAVAIFVHSLLALPDREGGIGKQVREIAQAQNDSKEKVAEELEAVESRSKIKTFFIGTDYKNLGALRSEMVKAGNQIAKLGRLMEKATDPNDKAALESQIQTLSEEKTKIDNFIKANESQFSLFGWAIKLFQ